MPSPEYFAGFFDGEGCVSICYCKLRPKKSAPIERIMGFKFVAGASNTDLAPLALLKARYGGHINLSRPRNAKQKAVYAWKVTGRDTIRTFLLDILPYSIVKRAQIEIGLRYLDTVAETGKRIGQHAWDKRLGCYQDMQLLNKRGAGSGHKRDIPSTPSLGWNPKHRNLTKEQLSAMSAHMRSGRMS